jgi:hypothetical protein
MRFAPRLREALGCSRGHGHGVGVAPVGGRGSAGRHGTTTGTRGPWTVRPLPRCRQREAGALLARSVTARR